MVRRYQIGSALAALLAFGGCAQIPEDSTGRFSYVSVQSRDRNGVAVTREVLWPDACLKDETLDDPPLGRRPPPGCANDYNLLHMVEREGDLVRGRRLGAAPAAPSARAAQRYIDGADGPLGAGTSEPGGFSSPPPDDGAATPGAVKPANSATTLTTAR